MHSYSVNSKHRKMKFDQIRDHDPLSEKRKDIIYLIQRPQKIKEPTHANNNSLKVFSICG